MLKLFALKVNIMRCNRFLGLFVITLAGFANADPWNSNYEHFDLNINQLQHLSLVPVRMMDDDALFASAKAQRKNLSPDSQLLLNVHWLLSKDFSEQNAKRNLRKNLRESFSGLGAKPGDLLFRSIKSKKSLSLLGEKLKNSRVRIKHDEVRLTYELIEF